MPRTTKPVTISLDERTIKKAKRLQSKRGFQHSLSALVAHLINRDAEAIAKADTSNGKEPAHA